MSWDNLIEDKPQAGTSIQTATGADPIPVFTFEEDVASDKIIYCIYGKKGEGKTTAAFMFKGTKACISFDKKSSVIKNNYYANDNTIAVYDAVKHLRETVEHYTKSADTCVQYIDFLLDNIAKNPPDYIIIDGLEILQKIAEMSMRYKNNLSPFQGVANMNLWKIRALIIRDIHNKALSIAKKGIIYTTYVDKDEVIIEGSTITKDDNPKWADIILWQTDVVLRVTSAFNKKARETMLRVESSKVSKFKSGTTYNITDKKELEV